MDLVTCEAPLDNSFQKDRRELVNKGSLGRRRKPSRSNLRLILSPANDQQDVEAFHGHQHLDSDGSFVQVNVSHVGHVEGPFLDNQQESLNTGGISNTTIKQHRFEDNHQTVDCNNYREVVASINQLYTLKSVDFNGNSHQSLLKSSNRQNAASPTDHVERVRSNHRDNSNSHSQVSIAKNVQNVKVENHRPNGKLCNGHPDIKSNGYHKTDASRVQRVTEPKGNHQTLKISNQQQTVASKNHLNVITFSNHRQIITSSPIESKKSTGPNAKLRELTSSNHSSPGPYKESSLPRTSKEPNLVAEAQQFSIEAKLRRKKSEVQGRSAVLIQTWERRTQFESFSKLRRDCKSGPKSRLSGKENSDAMPDSYICIKYKGSLQNGDKLQKGELVPRVRDVSPDETMLYRVADERQRRFRAAPGPANGGVTVNGNSSGQEPEWISLSRKLCAKFVEGHIEPHSPDSYPKEEPEGVGEEPTPSPHPTTHSGVTPQTQPAVQRRRLVPAPFFEENNGTSGDTPPWIHLSRKLCNKFIEEHIEYPPITNGHFVEVPDLIEPNGDVRIIEKVGKPRGNKSKQRKECEPEWISLSKKLRAKFIESHIDDPDTIALDNQLNASDPEETCSETLSDVSQDLSVPKHHSGSLEPVECKNLTVRSQVVEREPEFEDSQNELVLDGSIMFPNKECSWEYQEMEFDQESNSGNFHEPEFVCGEPLQEARAHRGSLPDDSGQFEDRLTFSQFETRNFQNPECYNNDVKFLPYHDEEVPRPEAQQHNKLITVQFIARPGGDRQNKIEAENDVPHHAKNSKCGSFFNLSTWEEAHIEQHDDEPNSQDTTMSKNLRSKSLDNLCDSLEERSFIKENNFGKKEEEESQYSVEDRILFDSGDGTNEKGNQVFLHEFKVDPESSSDVSSMKESANCASEDMVSETGNGVSYSNSFNRPGNRENISHYAEDVESSSEDEVFETTSKNKAQSSKDLGAHYGKISARKSPVLEEKKMRDEIQVGSGKVKHDHCNMNGKIVHCNGMIPNSIYDGLPEKGTSSSKHNQTASKTQNAHKEPVKLGMSKWITMSKSEQNINRPEYSNLKSTIQKESKNASKSSGSESVSKSKPKKNNNGNKINENKTPSTKKITPQNTISKYHGDNYAEDFNKTDENSNRYNGFPKEYDLKTKCKSLCDISHSSNSSTNDSSFKHHESVADLCSGRRTPNQSQIQFQHFEFESEIPLCAKLVSNHDKKMLSKNAMSSSNRTDSPCPSESSHVYEDMFKETPSGPSDSEASSWVMKNNTYYINGRSSSMNDLDFSDSCSMSVKCDYASSSENSTLQSRHSSYASSSFYVNLRDYDSHMLEPSLNKGKTNGLPTNSGSSSNIARSNPPTPESLRHLFTSPLSSIHSPPNRAPRPLSRMPSDPQSHYYSTATATSSAFKHGFALTPPKPKKAERSSSVKIKDIAHGIILTFKRFHSHSKSSGVPSADHVDVSHLAEMKSNSELGKTSKGQKNSKKHNHDKSQRTENGRTDTDSGFLSDVQRAKARRSSSDLSGMKSNSELFNSDKKKSKSSKKNSSKGKKSRSKASEPRTVPTVSRKVQQMADGTLYLVTTVSGDTALPGVYSDSPDTSSELSSHKPVKVTGESNC